MLETMQRAGRILGVLVMVLLGVAVGSCGNNAPPAPCPNAKQCGPNCIATADPCCDNIEGFSCLEGEVCCGTGRNAGCAPTGSVCCDNVAGLYCPSGMECCNSNSQCCNR